jgi:hypothetical protein
MKKYSAAALILSAMVALSALGATSQTASATTIGPLPTWLRMAEGPTDCFSKPRLPGGIDPQIIVGPYSPGIDPRIIVGPNVPNLYCPHCPLAPLNFQKSLGTTVKDIHEQGIRGGPQVEIRSLRAIFKVVQ